jgi:hypothetical protein
VDYAKAQYGCRVRSGRCRVRGAEVQGTQRPLQGTRCRGAGYAAKLQHLQWYDYSGASRVQACSYRGYVLYDSAWVRRCRVRSGYNRRFKDLILREA